MNTRFFVYLGIFCSGGLINAFLWNRIARRVNQHLPENEQYSLSIWSIRRNAVDELNQLRIWRLHREFFPDSYLRLWFTVTMVLTVSWMLFGLSILNA
jgi:hypothetical protein